MVPFICQYIDGVYSQQLRGLALEFTVRFWFSDFPEEWPGRCSACSRSPLWKKPDRTVLRARKGAARVGNTPGTSRHIQICLYPFTSDLLLSVRGSSTRLPSSIFHPTFLVAFYQLSSAQQHFSPQKRGETMEVDVKGAAHCSFDRCPGLRNLYGSTFKTLYGNPQCLFMIR